MINQKKKVIYWATISICKNKLQKFSFNFFFNMIFFFQVNTLAYNLDMVGPM